MNRLMINTSIEDMSSSLKLRNPSTQDEALKLIDELWLNLRYEARWKNRSVVRKLLRNKIKNTYKIVQ
jgi:hypothetical protein